ncbi:MAG: hypothetical protein AAGH88_04625 [Planctomycetota bacterium]
MIRLIPALFVLLSMTLIALPQSADETYRPRALIQGSIERQTVLYPDADGRQPLTSDRLSTASTRLIDARRGLRPYDRAGCYPAYRTAYRDRFGIIRADPYTRLFRKPATGVTTTANATSARPRAFTQPAESPEAEQLIYHPPMRVVIIDQRRGAAEAADTEHLEQNPPAQAVIRVHRDKPSPVTEPGTAVLTRSDGTVIEIR